MRLILLGLVLLNWFLAAWGDSKVAAAHPPGTAKKATSQLLESGAKLTQTFAPLQGYNVYIVAFHPLKNNPKQQMTAYHYCKQVNEDFMQCILFDSNTRNANLIGIEYIVSGKLYAQLPRAEKQYWHPHNYEILSGQLIAPGIPAAAEKALMRKKLNSYGKTWHVWMTNGSNIQKDNLPLGNAELAWSINHDGEIDPKLVKERDKLLGVNTAAKRKERQDLAGLAQPQEGVNAIANKFDTNSK